MKNNSPLIDAAYRTIDAADALIASNDSQFASVYKQYKSLQSLWFRVIEDAAELNSSRLEDLSIDLENAIQRCSEWIEKNSPNNKNNTIESS